MFRDRIHEMGLQDNGDETYSYFDRLSCVTYKQIYTPHEILPYLSVHTGPNFEDLRFVNMVSDLYQFEGNEVINESLRRQIGHRFISNEETLINKNYTAMYNEFIIDNSDSPEDNIYPVISIMNSYNGTGKKTISFGLSLYEPTSGYRYGMSFRNLIGTFSQVHAENRQTEQTNIFSNYIQLFSENIEEVVTENLNRVLSDDEIYSTLSFIEKLGKKRKRSISVALQELEQVTAWGLFRVITKYSTQEKNINIRALMENIVERNLYLPERLKSLV